MYVSHEPVPGHDATALRAADVIFGIRESIRDFGRQRAVDLDRYRQHGDDPRPAHGDAAGRWQGARGGGYSSGPEPDPLATAELYDPGSGSWTATGEMIEGRGGHTATLLPDGRVLVTGGTGNGLLASAELYDPGRGSWTATTRMAEARLSHMATLLPDGRVLVAGGCCRGPLPEDFDSLASAELYDPVSGSWTATGGLIEPRGSHSATLLPDGKVLVAGGSRSSHVPQPLASAELYDPSSGSWTATGNMGGARQGTATLLLDGRVLAAGDSGYVQADGGYVQVSAELYDPGSGSWSATGKMIEARTYGHTATLLPDGRVLVAGGSDGSRGLDLASTELYDSRGGT